MGRIAEYVAASHKVLTILAYFRDKLHVSPSNH